MFSVWSTAAVAFGMVLPYGRGRLIRVLLVVAIQGTLQALAVVAIYAFLSSIMYLSGAAKPTPSTSIDANVALSQTSGTVVLGVLAVGLLLTAALVKLLATRVLSSYTFGVSCWLQDRLLRTVLAQPFAFHLAHNSTTLAKVIQADVVLISRELLRPLLDTVATVVVAVIVGGTLVVLNPALTLIVASALVAVYAVVFAVQGRRRRAIGRDMRTYGHAVHREVNETLIAAGSVYVFGAADYFASRCARAARAQADAQTRNAVVGEAPRGFAEPILVAVVVAVFAVATARGQDAASLVPIVGTLAVAGFRLIPQIQNAFSSASKIDTARPHADEIVDLLNLSTPDAGQSSRESATGPGRPRWTGDMRLTDVQFRYGLDRSLVLAGVDLHIRAGQTIAIVGPSGSGKTTLLEIVTGLLQPTSGTVSVDGEPMDRTRIPWWQQQIGYVPQEAVLLDDTVLANVAFGQSHGEANRAQAWQALAAAQLADFVRSDLPEGLDSRVGERGSSLSGGQRQRLGLARALYRQPELLLLDEATNQLDAANENSLLAAVARLQGRLAIVQVAHRLNPVLAAEAIYELDAGRLRLVANNGDNAAVVEDS